MIINLYFDELIFTENDKTTCDEFNSQWYYILYVWFGKDESFSKTWSKVVFEWNINVCTKGVI